VDEKVMDTTHEETIALARERLEFEKANAAQAHELATREILVKEKEYLLKETEAKSQKWFNPLTWR
jgi:hypothetical protein